jgi:hypothetical protein
MPTIAGLASSKRTGQIAFAIVRGFCLSLYFGQYAIRSALRVIVPEPTKAFGLTTLGVSSLLGLYYYTYSSFAIVARAALDRYGAAMIPYAIIKEVNPDKVKGSATGAINFLVFTLSALLAPAYGWLLNDLAGGGKLTETVFRNADSFGVAGIVLAIVLACFLRETGSASRVAAPTIKTAEAPT